MTPYKDQIPKIRRNTTNTESIQDKLGLYGGGETGGWKLWVL